MSIEETSLNKILLIFDFDETIIDKDSEYELAKMLNSKEEYDKIVEMDDTDYYSGFNYLFQKLKSNNFTLQDVNLTLDKMELSPKMSELFDYIRKNKSKYEIIIISGDIDYSINHILKHYNIFDLFDCIISNKSIIQNINDERLLYIPENQFPHSCNLCIESQCKGLELQKFLEKNGKKFKKIVFVCDGGNDFCPCKKVLAKGDVVFPRVGHWFCIRMKEENLMDQLTCDVYPWKNADEIINKLISFN